MGFLDHSTNNIIVDAVLTDLGRQKLARNDGSFTVVKFALGDDEVDYSMIKKFGVTVGREKIEKNTPIFEAQTSSSLGLKNKLISLSSQFNTALPILVNAANAASSNIATLSNSDRRGSDVTITQQMLGANAGATVSQEMQESVFMVRASNRFLEIRNGTTTLPTVYSTERDRMSIYRIATSASGGNRSVTLNIRPRQSLVGNSSIYNTFGDQNSYIRTIIVVTGLSTGAQHMISVALAPPS